MKFKASKQSVTQRVPWFEDREYSGHKTKKSRATLEGEVMDYLAKLGASYVRFEEGVFEPEVGDEKPLRYGWVISWQFGQGNGEVKLAALPLRTETPTKKEQALRQALYIYRNYLQSQYEAVVYVPGSVPLLPFLLDSNGVTVQENFISEGFLPSAPSVLLLPAKVS